MTPGREQDTSREADSPYRATRDGGQPGNAAPEPATTTATPTSASPAPGRGLAPDPQWIDARVVGAVVWSPTQERRWIVEQADGTQHRVVALVVQDDWATSVVDIL